MAKSWIKLGLISAGLGAAIGAVMCAIALDHNPQCEFDCPEVGGLQWDALGVVFGSWAMAGGGLVFVAGAAILLIRHASRE